MKKFLIVLGIVAVFLVIGVFLKDLIIKTAVTVAVSRITGTPVEMDRFSLDMFSSKIEISGFKMYNPGGFPEGTLVSCPKIKIIYDGATLFKEKRHFLLVEIELKEMVLTKNKEGKLSVDALKIAQRSDSSPSIPMQIDLLNLSIGKIISKDYTIGKELDVRVREVNKRKSYKGIPSGQQLVILVLTESMKAAAIKNAEIYGVAMMTGVAVLPVAVAATFIGKDHVQQIIDAGFEQVYRISLEQIKRMGRITKEDAQNGAIKANINGAMVALQLRKKEKDQTEITISARKFMFPKLDIAGGVLYQIVDQL